MVWELQAGGRGLKAYTKDLGKQWRFIQGYPKDSWTHRPCTNSVTTDWQWLNTLYPHFPSLPVTVQQSPSFSIRVLIHQTRFKFCSFLPMSSLSNKAEFLLPVNPPSFSSLPSSLSLLHSVFSFQANRQIPASCQSQPALFNHQFHTFLHPNLPFVNLHLFPPVSC